MKTFKKIKIIIGYHTGAIYANKSANKYDPDNWINQILIDFFDIRNIHYSESFKSWALPALRAALQENYVDSETTGYYYTTFGPSGQNRTQADFFILWQHVTNLVNSLIIKSGATLRHNAGAIIYNQNNEPNHTYNGNDIYVISSTDGFSNLTAIDLQQLSGNFCQLILTGCPAAGLNCNFNVNNTFTGILPNMTFLSSNAGAIRLSDMTGLDAAPLPNIIIGTSFTNFKSNNLNGINEFNYITLNLGNLRLDDNDIPTSDVDELFSRLNSFFTANTPIKNLIINISGGINGIPTGGASNTDILALVNLFTTAGFLFTAIINT